MDVDNYEKLFNALRVREEQFLIARARYLEVLNEIELFLVKKKDVLNYEPTNNTKTILIEHSQLQGDNNVMQGNVKNINKLEDDIYVVLKESGKLLTIMEITERLIERGRMFAGANPEASVNTCVSKGVSSGKFNKFSQGKFGLNEWCS